MKKNVFRIFALTLTVIMLAVPVLAATPSVTQSGTTIVPSVTQNGTAIVPSATQKGTAIVPSAAKENTAIAEGSLVIVDKDNKTVKEVPADALTLVSFVDRAKADADVAKTLEAAYKQLTEAKSLADVAPDFADALKETDKDLKAEDMTVLDLVDIVLKDEFAKILNEEGNRMALTFKMNIEKDETMLVLHNFEADKWETIYGEDVTVNDNGTVTVVFESLSPVAFVVKAN